MSCPKFNRGPDRRRGLAAVELAIMLPFLVFIFVAGFDFARIFYFQVTVTNCARNGAWYGQLDATHAADTSGIQAAAQADASNLNPLPKIDSTTWTDAKSVQWVKVTATYTFSTVVSWPGIPPSVTLVRSCQMRVEPLTPLNG
jgi:Flp pilus assembly protein TadG